MYSRKLTAPSSKRLAHDRPTTQFEAAFGDFAKTGGAVAAWRGVRETDRDVSELQHKNAMIKGQTNAMLTEAFVHAAMADKNIKLAVINTEDQSALKDLRSRLEVAVGIKIASRGDDGIEKVVLAPWTANFFPQPTDSKETPEWREKENFRSNFATAFQMHSQCLP
jgi:hypothetical protein